MDARPLLAYYPPPGMEAFVHIQIANQFLRNRANFSYNSTYGWLALRPLQSEQ